MARLGKHRSPINRDADPRKLLEPVEQRGDRGVRHGPIVVDRREVAGDTNVLEQQHVIVGVDVEQGRHAPRDAGLRLEPPSRTRPPTMVRSNGAGMCAYFSTHGRPCLRMNERPSRVVTRSARFMFPAPARAIAIGIASGASIP
jgi:hypothetical protein